MEERLMIGPMRKGAWVGAILAAAMSGCSGELRNFGPMKTETQSVKMGGAKDISALIEMGAGDLTVRGGARDLMEGKFVHRANREAPVVDYNVSGDHGDLEVKEAGNNHTNNAGDKIRWELELNSHVPTELKVEMGAGEANLELRDVSLTGLSVEMGAGSSTVDLTGNWKQSAEVSLEGGVGNVKVMLPRDVGVHVTVEGGLGSVSAGQFTRDGSAYVNAEYGKSPITIEVKVEGGVGHVDLELGGGTV
jgi:hypothetical protein